MLTYEQAGAIAPTRLARGIAKTVAGSYPLMALLPFARVEGMGHDYLREGSEIVPAWIDYGAVVNEKESASLRVHTDLAVMSDEIRLPGPAKRYMGAGGDQLMIQIRALLKAQVRSYMDKLWNGNRPTVTFTLAGVALATGGAGPNLRLGTGHVKMTVAGAVKTLAFQAAGDSDYGTASADVAAGDPQGVILTSKDGVQSITVNVTSGGLGGATVSVPATISTSTYVFDGIRRLADTNLVDTSLTGTNGGPYTFDLLRRALELNEADDGQRVIVMPPAVLRKHKQLQDVISTAPEIELGIAPGRKFPQFEGIPIVTERSLPVNLTKGTGTNLSEIWVLTLGTPSGEESPAMMVGYGLCGLYGGRGSAAAGIGETAGPDQPQEIEGETWYGFTIEDLGRIPGLDKYGTAVTFDGGAVLYSPLGASCVRYIETV